MARPKAGQSRATRLQKQVVEPVLGLVVVGAIVWGLWGVETGVPWWAIVFWILSGLALMLMAAFASAGGPKLVGQIVGFGVALIAAWSLGGYAGYRWLGSFWGALLGALAAAFVSALVAAPFIKHAVAKREAKLAEREAERLRHRFDAETAKGTAE